MMLLKMRAELLERQITAIEKAEWPYFLTAEQKVKKLFNNVGCKHD